MNPAYKAALLLTLMLILEKVTYSVESMKRCYLLSNWVGILLQNVNQKRVFLELCLECQEIEEKEYYLELASLTPPILGPDKIAVEECLNRVYGTAKRANDLILFVKRPEVRFMLRSIIEGLEGSAALCCRDGGLWKTCVGPLMDKWYLWNEKWKLFGIPPDPSWD